MKKLMLLAALGAGLTLTTTASEAKADHCSPYGSSYGRYGSYGDYGGFVGYNSRLYSSPRYYGYSSFGSPYRSYNYGFSNFGHRHHGHGHHGHRGHGIHIGGRGFSFGYHKH